jgi:hypothetical protein
MKVQVYIGEDKLDLFDDEKISITQKLNDIEKLSNVFTDFTNSFTVPATQNNNRILKHYYDVDVDGSFNANIRINGFIEIDTLPFKFGQFQLEGVVVKQHRPDNYKITFYSKTVQLSKLFGDDTIDRLDYDAKNVKQFNSLSQFDFVNSQVNLLDTLNNPGFKNGDIMTPLIAYADRDWNYGSNDLYDISNSTYPILTEELRQALRVIRIIEGIETKYGITFSREFFGNAMFNKLFLWLNNSGDKFFSTIADFTVPMTYAVPNPYYTGSLDLATNIITFDDFAFNYSPTRVFLFAITFYGVRRPNQTPSQLQGTKFTISAINPATGIEVFSEVVEHNGDFVQVLFEIPQSSVPISYDYKIFVSSNATFTFDRFSARFVLSGVSVFAGSYDNPGTYLDNNLVSYLMPTMKVIDFLQGIMKMFKLVIRPISPTNFYINTLDDFYSGGTILDITRYVDVANVNIDRPSIYRRITFTYLPTENVLGKKFRLSNDPINKKIGYGDLRSDYPQITENNDLSVELPFENMLFERLVVQSPNVNVGDLTNINIGQSCKLNEDQTLSKNDSKPILFFNNGTISISTYPLKYKFATGATVQTLNTIYNIGNTDNQVLANVTQTINWGSEIDPWHYATASQSLFNNYWKNWLETIYSIKQRKFKFEGYLPPRYIQELDLSDALIIGQNRYNISDYTIDLVTGKTIFNLFNDIKKQQQI